MPGSQRQCWQDNTARLSLIHTLDDWQGLINGIVYCPRHDQHAVVRMLDWGEKNLQNRVYSLANVARDSVEVFLRNMSTDYCDLTRRQNEVSALYTSSDPVESIILLHLPELEVLGTCPADGLPALEYRHWQQIKPDPASSQWFKLFDPKTDTDSL